MQKKLSTLTSCYQLNLQTDRVGMQVKKALSKGIQCLFNVRKLFTTSAKKSMVTSNKTAKNSSFSKKHTLESNSFALRTCYICGKEYTPTGARQIKCVKCKSKPLLPLRYRVKCESCGRAFMTSYKYQHKCAGRCKPVRQKQARQLEIPMNI